MGVHRENAREKKETTAPPQTSVVPRSRTLDGELDESDAFLRTAESPTPTEPSLERWTKFNECLMRRVLAARRHRPFSREWRKALFDRVSASDSRFSERKWITLAALVLAIFFALAYLATR